MELAAGTVLAGRYRVEHKLGEGGIGQVWAAKNIAIGSDVAVKVLFAASAANKELVMRFRREAYLLARVRSDHVARVLDLVSDEVYGLILVLDWIKGEALLPVIERTKLSVEQALDLATDITRGMVVLHRANIVHRDLKPGNVILEQLPEGRPRAVIVDFGLGRVMTSESNEISGITNDDTALGTVEYMAPEQIVNSRGVTASADIYSLGAMLYRSVTGEHMFPGLFGPKLAHQKLIEDSPPFRTGRDDAKAVAFEALVTRMLRRHAEERPQSSEELLRELMALYQRRRGEADAGALAPPALLRDDAPSSSTPSLPPLDSMPNIPATVSIPPEFARSPSLVPSSRRAMPAPMPSARGLPWAAVVVLVVGVLVGGALLGATLERIRAAGDGVVHSATAEP